MFRGQIDEKIKELVDYVISKPTNEITLDDYTVLRDVRCMESEEDTKARMDRLVSMASAGIGGFGS